MGEKEVQSTECLGTQRRVPGEEKGREGWHLLVNAALSAVISGIGPINATEMCSCLRSSGVMGLRSPFSK